MQYAPIIKHQEHSDKLDDQAQLIRQGMDIIHKTDPGHQRNAKQERPGLQPKERGIQPHPKNHNDPTTPQHNALVRAPLVGLVDDVAPVCNTEINQLSRQQYHAIITYVQIIFYFVVVYYLSPAPSLSVCSCWPVSSGPLPRSWAYPSWDLKSATSESYLADGFVPAIP